MIDPAKSQLRIEVVLAQPERQCLRELFVEPGTTIGAAIALSGIAEEFPELDIGALSVGVWGKIAHKDFAVQDGDRIEIYRPLPVNPRDARRQVAVDGGFMGGRIPGKGKL